MKKSLLFLSCISLAIVSCGNPDSSSTQEESTSTATETAPTTSTTPSGPMLPGEKLVATADCMGCHNKTQKVVGPAYVDVAAKYPSNEENINKLADVIIAGSKGTWGEIPMTPHPNLSKDDAKQMVTWILSLKKE